MKKILIVADSMAMPRGEVKYENTWIYKLQQYLESDYIIIDKTKRASTSERLVEEGGGYKNIKEGADLLEHYEPNIVIIQIGITDCSPRYLNKNKLFTKILNRSPQIIQNTIYSFLKKYSSRKPKYSDVSPDKFRENLETYIQRAFLLNTTIIALSISPVTSLFQQKSPHINNNINHYNALMKDLENRHENFKVISPLANLNFNEIAVDELHYNEVGHHIIFETLKDLI